MTIKKASALWKGDLKAGTGTVSTASGALNGVPYDFKKRFEDAPGTNPEELVGAAHASCYSMAFALFTANAGLQLESVETKAAVTLEAQGGGFAVTRIHLDVAAKVPGASPEAFQKIAEETKANCPISKLLRAEITLSAKQL